jgi:hypothetical protein
VAALGVADADADAVAGPGVGVEAGASADRPGCLEPTDDVDVASMLVDAASVETVATVVEVCMTMKSSTSSTCLAPPAARLGAALAKRPPPTAAMARQAIPNVVVAVTEYVIASRRSTRSPFVINSSWRA